MSRRLLPIFVATATAISQAGCGTVVPQVNEAWEGRDVDSDTAIQIKQVIFCDLVNALKATRANRKVNSQIAVPDDYGVQVQTEITIEEHTGFNPALTYNRVFSNGNQSGTSINRNFNFGFGASATTTATRTDSTYSYYLVGRIANPGKNVDFCKYVYKHRSGSSPFIQSDLGIKDFLLTNAEGSLVLPSSPGAKKDAKLDVYSYEIKFALVSNGNVNPMFKLVNLSGGGGTPFLDVGRSRTHDLTLTFGPNNPADGNQPTQLALIQHVNQTLKSNLRRP